MPPKPPANETCETCRFWKPPIGERGRCCRFPPCIPAGDLQVRASQAVHGDGEGLFIGWWPETLAGEWCGEYQRGE